MAFALINSIPGCLAAVGTFWLGIKVMKSNEHINETRTKINDIEKNTNSLATKLVVVTGQAEFAKGESGKPPGFPIKKWKRRPRKSI